MARPKVQRTIDAKIWASVASSISKKYKTDNGASAKVSPFNKDILVQKLTAALLIMKQPCPRSWYDIKIFPQWVHALQTTLKTDISAIVNLYNENSGGTAYQEYKVDADMYVSYKPGRRMHLTNHVDLADRLVLTATDTEAAIKACITRFITPENKKWLSSNKTWDSYTPYISVVIKQSGNTVAVIKLLEDEAEPTITRYDNIPVPEPAMEELPKWSIRYEYKDGDEWDTASEWVSASSKTEAESEFWRDHYRGRCRIVSITPMS